MKNMELLNLKAFTILELMVVVIIVGIITSFSIPNYQKAIRKAHEKDAIQQLLVFHEALQLYYNKEGEFPDATDGDHAFLNATLGANLIENDLAFDYDSSPIANSYELSVTWEEKPTVFPFEIRINEDKVRNDNPCCNSGAGTCKLVAPVCS